MSDGALRELFSRWGSGGKPLHVPLRPVYVTLQEIRLRRGLDALTPWVTCRSRPAFPIVPLSHPYVSCVPYVLYVPYHPPRRRRGSPGMRRPGRGGDEKRARTFNPCPLQPVPVSAHRHGGRRRLPRRCLTARTRRRCPPAISRQAGSGRRRFHSSPIPARLQARHSLLPAGQS
jgi:hypothetical protein